MASPASPTAVWQEWVFDPSLPVLAAGCCTLHEPECPPACCRSPPHSMCGILLLLLPTDTWTSGLHRKPEGRTRLHAARWRA